jgi:hypothetical protein
MGIHDSSRTRVQPILGQLLTTHGTNAEWVLRLWDLARRDGAAPPPASAGTLKAELLDTDPKTGVLRAFEGPVPPPTEFLRWLILHPEKLAVPDDGTFGTTDDNAARTKRADLFSTDPTRREAAQAEALAAIDRLGAGASSRKWWAFEGFTHVDCCLETDTFLLFIEGKRTEPISASTRWFRQRNQIWRNLEAASELAAGRVFGVILAVENEAERLLDAAVRTRDDSLPHLPQAQREELQQHLLGAITWGKIISTFKVSPQPE